MKLKLVAIVVVTLICGLVVTGVSADTTVVTPNGQWVSSGGLPVVFESIGSDANPANDFAFLSFTPTAPVLFSEITRLSAVYTFTLGDCHGGALRWSIRVSPVASVFVYYGGLPGFTECTTANNQSGTNMLSLADLRFDTSQVGGTFYDTYASALALVGAMPILRASLVLDGGWAGDQRLTLSSATFGTAGYTDIWTPPPLITLTFTLEELTPGGPVPYVPGTWARYPVRATWTCTTVSGSGLVNWLPWSGFFTTARFVQTFENSGVYTLAPRGNTAGDNCRDTAGNVAPAAPLGPLSVKVDRGAPSCTIYGSVKTVPVGPVTPVSWTVTGSDSLSGVASILLETVTLGAGASAPGWMTGTFDTSGSVQFTTSPSTVRFTYRVTDNAGNSVTCRATATTP